MEFDQLAWKTWNSNKSPDTCPPGVTTSCDAKRLDEEPSADPVNWNQ